MVEIRFHGKIGQRAMDSAELTALAAITQGKYAETFHSTDSQLNGEHVIAYVRVSDRPIGRRKKKPFPNVAVVLDASLSHSVDVTVGLRRNGLVIMNTPKPIGQVREETGIKGRLGVVDASHAAMEINSIPVGEASVLDTLIIASQGLQPESTWQPEEPWLGPHLASNPAWGSPCEESLMEAY